MPESNRDQISYLIPEGVLPWPAGQHILQTREGGKVALDEAMCALWAYAGGRTLDEILEGFDHPAFNRNTLRSAMACLSEAGLVERSKPVAPSKLRRVTGTLVSIIITTHRGEGWIPDCLASIRKQNYSPIEVIIIDNASNWPIRPWLKSITRIPGSSVTDNQSPWLPQRTVAWQRQKGAYYLLINDDTLLAPDAVAEMVRVFLADPQIAAVAPKLKLYWARNFFNGVGNRVDAHSWGTDNAFGHLDLGQFDTWREIPSVCTAAAMFSRNAWKKIGKMDEMFPIYYDDVEWSYRARLMGYKTMLAPKSVVFHAFGGRIPTAST